MGLSGESEEPLRPHGWTDWYRFARDELGFAHDESTEYANLRFVEEQNRDVLRGSGDVGGLAPEVSYD